MASTYPGTLDAFTTIASDKKTSDSVGGRTHRDMHNDLGDAVEAVQAELGTDPAGTFSTVKARLDQLVAYAAKTSAYTATVADHTLNVTSGTFTLDLPAASTCTGQSLKVKNSGSGVVTLDGNSSETVEGVATFPLGPGSYLEITSTGSAWIITGGVPDTGWRDVTADLLNGWASSSGGKLVVRRVGNRVALTCAYAGITGAGSSSATFYNPPSGLQESATAFGTYGLMGLAQNAAGGAISSVIRESTSGLTIRGADTSWTIATVNASWDTADAWPTSLPGSVA